MFPMVANPNIDQLTAYSIWNYAGPNSGQFTPAASRAETLAAEAAGWGQDARQFTGLQLMEAGPPGPLPPDPDPEPDPEPQAKSADVLDLTAPAPASGESGGSGGTTAKSMEAGETYAHRAILSAPVKRGRGRPRKISVAA